MKRAHLRLLLQWPELRDLLLQLLGCAPGGAELRPQGLQLLGVELRGLLGGLLLGLLQLLDQSFTLLDGLLLHGSGRKEHD